jgi:hypothetical protein
MTDFPVDPDDESERGDSPIKFYVPPEQETGVYANTVAVWHTPYDFVIDFGAVQPAQERDPDDPSSPIVIPVRVVSRVHIPLGLVFDLIQAINARMEAYEAYWGEIQRPEPRDEESQE